jgi:ribosome-associated protein
LKNKKDVKSAKKNSITEMEQEKIVSELTFKAVRSSGAGGQNVNKVSSKVVLFFDLGHTEALDEVEKLRLINKLATKLTSENILILNCDEDRSQLKNKEIVTKRFLELIKKGLHVPKPRKPTKIPRSVIERRLKDKSTTADVKLNRKKPDLE